MQCPIVRMRINIFCLLLWDFLRDSWSMSVKLIKKCAQLRWCLLCNRNSLLIAACRILSAEIRNFTHRYQCDFFYFIARTSYVFFYRSSSRRVSLCDKMIFQQPMPYGNLWRSEMIRGADEIFYLNSMYFIPIIYSYSLMSVVISIIDVVTPKPAAKTPNTIRRVVRPIRKCLPRPAEPFQYAAISNIAGKIKDKVEMNKAPTSEMTEPKLGRAIASPTI